MDLGVDILMFAALRCLVGRPRNDPVRMLYTKTDGQGGLHVPSVESAQLSWCNHRLL